MAPTGDLEQALAPYLGAEIIITSPISTLSVNFLLYGIYCVVFGLAIHALCSRDSPAHKLYTRCSIALFVLATIYTAINAWGTSRQALIGFHAASTKDYSSYLQYIIGDDRKNAWFGSVNIISNLMNSIADIMLIHRCYVIFNSNKFVLFPLVFTACVLNGIDFGCMITGITGSGTSSKPDNATLLAKEISIDNGALLGIVAFQIVLAFITGGRIWWITCQTNQLIKGLARPRYNNIVAIIIESGLLYAGSLLATLVLEQTLDPNMTGVLPFIPSVLPVLMSGLAPTIIIARIAYGKSVDSVQQTLSMFHIADTQTSQQISIGMSQANIDLQLQTQPGIGDLQGVEEPSATLAVVEKV